MIHATGQSRRAKQRRSRPSRFAHLAVSISLMLASSPAAAEVFDDRGFNRNRDFFSQLPFEHIDPLTGNLLLTHTDLVLPGNAGLDLRIQRTYNSKIYRDYNLAQTMFAEDSWAGVGWTLHLGRVFNVLGVDTASPVVEMPDGSRHPMFREVGGTGNYISRDYWLYNKNTRVLSLPNGVTYKFDRQTTVGSTSVGYATEIRDPFGNTITISYLGTPLDAISSIVQDLGGGQQRTVTFDVISGELRGMHFGSSAWSYTHSSTDQAGFSILTDADPPVGQGWHYDYQTATPPKWELMRVTTPQGGQIEYTYGDFFSRLGSFTAVKFHAVKTRKTQGRDVPVDTWDYSYAQGSSFNETVISGPCNTVTMRFLGVGNTSAGAVWLIGLMDQRTIKEGTTVVQTEQLTWRTPLFGDRISDDDQSVGFNQDAEIYVPLVERRTITRNGRPYTTVNSYHTVLFNDYGRPWTVDEEGDIDRTTERVFDYAFTPYIKDRIKSEKVTLGSESFTRSFEYEDATGFLTDETVYGILEEYTRNTRGNVASIKDRGTSNPAGNVTSFPSYSWGQAATIQTPQHTITRTINPSGTIASETRRGLTTGFEYDRIFRPTKTTPPGSSGANPTITSYDNTGDLESFTVSRGASFTRTDLDGFGRPTGTENAVGIKTDIDYDACGRRAYESYPFTATNLGSTYEYDALDRITSKKNPSHPALGVTEVRYAYTNGGAAHGGIDVSITNERNKTTVQTWKAFGHPGDGRLTRVQDADNKVWLYSYNAVGGLTGVSDTGGLLREWRYFSAAERPSGYGLLKDELHPENEGRRIVYDYHPNGLMRTRTDALSVTAIYLYDGNNRLTKADRPGTANDVDIGYDASDNRRTLLNGYVSSTFGYDDANRLTSRTDVIGGRTFVTGYVPDGNDNVRRLDYHGGLSITYDYDDANRITAVRRTGSACPGGANCFAHTVNYHPSGGVSSFVAGNGGTHTVTYDPSRYWITDVNAGSHLALGYRNYDGVGNVRDIVDARAGFNQHFEYDNLDRVTTANGPWGGGSFGYDGLGNRTSKTIGAATTTYTYPTALQRLTSASGGGEDDNFSYDFNGNLRTQAGRVYTYTPENMLETATVAGGPATTYRYDGDGLRKIKEAGGSRRFFVHGLGSQLLSEWNEPCAGAIPQRVKDHVYLGSRLLAMVRPAVAPVAVSFTAATMTVPEAQTSASVGVRLQTGDASPIVCPVTVRVTRSAGTATPGLDFSAAPQDIVFPQGTASGTELPASLGLIDDALDEDDETYTLTLAATGADVAGAGVLPVTIQDDDPTPTVSTTDQSRVEGDTGTSVMVFPVRLSAASGRTVEVAFATRDGTATAPADYDTVAQTLTFSPGTTEILVPVTIKSDRLDEADNDTFDVVLTPVRNVAGGGVWRGIIVDDDPLPVVSTTDKVLSPEGHSGTQDLVYTVTLNTESGREVRVNFTTADVTARNGFDYIGQWRTLIFPPGITSIQVPVAIVGERVYEPPPDETFSVTLENPVNVVVAAPGAWQGAIVDDDPAPTLSVSDCAVVEPPDSQNGVPCRFEVTLSNPSHAAVSVDFATAATVPPAAQAGPDYEASSGTITFDAETSQLTWTRSVTVLPDTQDEGNESFLMRLSNAAGGGATIANGEAVGTIIDNELGRFYPVPACRVLDTRVTGPALSSGSERSFTLSDNCTQLPVGTKAVVLNVTVVQPAEPGNLQMFPRGLRLPTTSVISFAAGRARANNATVLMGAREQVTVRGNMPSPAGTVHVVVDVYGYYR